MAAAVVAARSKLKTMTVLKHDEAIECVMTKLPNESKRKADVELGTLLNGMWQRRRVVYTRKELCFALVGEDEVRDHIPIRDISFVGMMQCDEMDEPPPPVDHHKSIRRMSREKSEGSFSTLSNTFQIRTKPDGFNSGRIYYFRADTIEICEMIVQDLKKFSDLAKSLEEKASMFLRSQAAVRTLYRSTPFQTLSGIVIIANFASSIASAEMATIWKVEQPDVWDVVNKFDLFFVSIFTAELLINLYANWFREFVTNVWSMFDLLIVTLSLLGLAPIGIPMSLLLLLRSCRVLRIFGKLRAVSKIFSALSESILPMANVFFIIFVIASIYSIAGITFFQDQAPEEFATFSSAFIGMFRITCGSEWWFDRFPAVKSDGGINWFPSLFLISYVIIVLWVFFQVSIAVLLDNFLAASTALQYHEFLEMIQTRKQAKQFRNPLDPLLLRLSKDYSNEADLSNRLKELFQLLDSDASGDLSSREFQAAIRKLVEFVCIDSDFVAITQNGKLCNERGHLGPMEFENVMVEQLRLYTLSRLSSTSELWTTTDEEYTSIGTLKQILMDQCKMKKELETTKRDIREILQCVQSNNGIEARSYERRSDCDKSMSAIHLECKTEGCEVFQTIVESKQTNVAERKSKWKHEIKNCGTSCSTDNATDVKKIYGCDSSSWLENIPAPVLEQDVGKSDGSCDSTEITGMCSDTVRTTSGTHRHDVLTLESRDKVTRDFGGYLLNRESSSSSAASSNSGTILSPIRCSDGCRQCPQGFNVHQASSAKTVASNFSCAIDGIPIEEIHSCADFVMISDEDDRGTSHIVPLGGGQSSNAQPVQNFSNNSDERVCSVSGNGEVPPSFPNGAQSAQESGAAIVMPYIHLGWWNR